MTKIKLAKPIDCVKEGVICEENPNIYGCYSGCYWEKDILAERKSITSIAWEAYKAKDWKMIKLLIEELDGDF